MTSQSENEPRSADGRSLDASRARSNLIAERNGYILFCPTGIYTIGEVEAQFEQLRHRLAIQRKTGQPVKVLIDVRQAAVQPKETAAYIQEHTDQLYDASDSVVILVEGPIQKLQMKRVAAGRTYQIVQSLAEAEAYLGVR